jgi:hypothetical protein
MHSAPETFQLKIRLLGISPMIWRRVLVSTSITLRELHGALQVAMGWDGIHLFQFDIHAVDYGSWELHAASPDIPLSGFGFRRNDRLSYIYDMGCYWKHEVRIEAILDPDPKKLYPVCTGGAGACPPEECGGPEGYLAQRDEANGYDAWQDLAALASFGQDLLERHDTGQALEDLDLEDLEYVLDRMKAREPYLATSFFRRDVNTQFRDGRHRDLMHQQLM